VQNGERFLAEGHVSDFSSTTLEEQMTKTPTWRRRLLVPLLAAAAVALPLGLSADGSLGVAEACAQTGTCVKNDNTCVINGTHFFPGTWEGA
jgi:hypothetical protein